MWFNRRPGFGNPGEIDGGAADVVSWGLRNRAPQRAHQESFALTELRNQLITIVEAKGLLHLDPPVLLASGDISPDFIDGKRALANGHDLETACRALIELVRDAEIEFDAVGGLTLGADHFSHGVAMITGCDWFTVRKAVKGRGTNQRIEGTQLDESTRVLLVDDVVTRGDSIKQAYEQIRATGATIVAAVTLVDRGGNANEFFDAEGVFYRPLVTYADLGIEPVGRGLLHT